MKAIFYDMDGTLVHFKIDFKLARLKAIQVMEKHGIPKGRYNIEKPTLTSAKDAKEYMRSVLKYSETKIKDIMIEVHDAIVLIEAEASHKATSVEGIPELLEYCKSLGLLQIVITFNTHHNAEVSLKNAGILEYIDDIYGRDDVKKPKPDINHIKTAADKYSLTKEDCIMIGDHINDINAAKAFGCTSIGILRDGEMNEMKGADYTINQKDIPLTIIDIIKTKMKK